MKVTLGGERLGSGNKQQIELHHYERSTHDMGYLWRSTMSAGTLVPFMKLVAKPGDTFDINLGCDVKTHPTIGPLFGSYKVQLDVFQCPIRLYQGQLHNNKLGIGLHMQNVKLPIIRLKAVPFPADATPMQDIDNSQINPSCILKYFGIRGVGNNETGEAATRDFNAVPFLAYWDIYKNYYANKQEEIGAVIHTNLPTFTEGVQSFAIQTIPPDAGTTVIIPVEGAGTADAQMGTRSIAEVDNAPAAAQDPATLVVILSDGRRVPFTEAFRQITNPTPETLKGSWNFPAMGQQTVVNYDYIGPQDVPHISPGIETFDLENIDTMRELILAATQNPAAFNVNDQALSPYSLVLGQTSGGFQYMMMGQEGLALKTYQSDLLNNWIQTEWIDGTGGINEITAISTADGDQFTLDTLIFARKVYDMLNRIAISGGTYKDWINAAYDHEGFTQFETPMYWGGLIKELVFQEVINNSESQTEEGTQPLGTLAGKGVMAGKHKGGSLRIKIDEHSYLIGIISLTPRLDYSQGNEWDVNLLTMDDFHKPGLDQIGFQELITEQMHWADTWADTVVGGVANWTQRSAGKQPAWTNYTTEINKTFGNFAIAPGEGDQGGGEMFMTLNRRYEINRDATPATIRDLTTYIDPTKFNQIFAQRSLDAQNFWVQVSVDITARRKQSARVMPNL